MVNVCWKLLLLFGLITGDVTDANGDKLPARKQTLRANKSDQVTLSLGFGVLERGAYLERETSPTLVLANERDDFWPSSPSEFDQRENLIVRDNRRLLAKSTKLLIAPTNYSHNLLLVC